MQEKQAIITLNYGYEINAWYKYMREVFIPSIKDYAKRINVDFILMNNNNNKYYNTWNQLQFMDYLDYYDRVMYIDEDCYIPKLFRYNFFNKVDNDKIGLYEYITPKVKQCNLLFIIMILNKVNKIVLSPPPNVYEQKYQYSNNGYHVCFMGKIMRDRCYSDEECYMNECINKHNLKQKVIYLEHLKQTTPEHLLISSMTRNNGNYIYHITLNTQLHKSYSKRNNTINMLSIITR